MLRKKYGEYVKVVIDIVREVIVLGCELHVDGAEFLLKEGSLSHNLWGGGVNWKRREIDTSAVFNLRPRLENNSMEIINLNIRKRFLDIARRYLLANDEQ